MTSKRRWAWVAGGLLWVAGAWSNGVAAQEESMTSEVKLPGTQEWTLHGDATGRDYLIQVAVPDSPPPASGYPVLYVLDGNARFPLAVVARDTLTRQGPSGPGSHWLIIGVGYVDTPRFDVAARSEDYTPPLPGLARTDDRGRPQGGGERFLAFLQRQLKPAIAARFAVDDSRQALLGHSYGGLFALYTLLSHPEAFSDYIAVSPSLWWGDGYLYRLLSTAPDDSGSRRLLMGVGSHEMARRPAFVTTEDDHAPVPPMRDNAERMARTLRERYPGWYIDYQRFSGVGHGAVMWPAMQLVWPFLDKKEH